jgi:hypothetical protein
VSSRAVRGRSARNVDAFVTYDDRLAAAARSIGLPVASPT